MLDEELNFSDHYPVKCEVYITGARVSDEKVNGNERYSYVWSQEAKMKYDSYTGVGLQRWIEDIKQCGMCICDSYDCANLSHNNMINNAYLRFDTILREGSAQYYVKKRVNNIAGWINKLFN